MVLCGLCTLIPLPFLDGWCERRVTRKLLDATAKARGVELDAAVLYTLTHDRSSMLLGCLYAVFIWPFKKLFSTLFVILVIKQAFDAAALAAHRAAMLRLALDRGLLASPALQAIEGERVRDAMDATLSDVRTSPLGRALRRLRNPAVPVPEDADPLVRVVESMRRYAGAGPVLDKFAAVLDGR